jgi:hypothetical protein
VGLTVGELRDFLEGWDDQVPVAVYIPGPDFYLSIKSENLSVGSGQGQGEHETPEEDEIQISWEPGGGWTA